MKILETVFHLPGFLSIRGKKMKIFNFFGETFPTSGVFIFCNNHTEGETMIEVKKRIFVNQQLIKKFVLGWGVFRSPGFLPYVKGNKKMKILETVFHFPGFLSHVKGDKMKNFNFLGNFLLLREFTLRRCKNEKI